MIVGSKEIGHRSGVYRAARVLQEERVVKVGEVLRRQSELLADLHPDQACANGMPGRLTLGQVEGMRQ